MAELQAALHRKTVCLPLCHMEYVEKTDGVWEWQEATPLPSPFLPVCLALHPSSYEELNLPLPRILHGHNLQDVHESGVADSGAQMILCSEAMAKNIGVDTANLLPVRARVFGASRDAEIQITGWSFPEGHAA